MSVGKRGRGSWDRPPTSLRVLSSTGACPNEDRALSHYTLACSHVLLV